MNGWKYLGKKCMMVPDKTANLAFWRWRSWGGRAESAVSAVGQPPLWLRCWYFPSDSFLIENAAHAFVDTSLHSHKTLILYSFFGATDVYRNRAAGRRRNSLLTSVQDEGAGKTVGCCTYSHLVPSSLISKEKKGWTYIYADYFVEHKQNVLPLDKSSDVIVWDLAATKMC